MNILYSKDFKIDYSKTLYIFLGVILVNLIFALILFPWATDKDINGLVGSNIDKFITLFYFGVTIFTTSGFGDVYAKSNKLKIFITLYMLLVISFAIHLYI
jgi:hypothetical protein